MASTNVPSVGESFGITLDFDFAAFDAFVLECERASGVLKNADGDTMRVRSIIVNQKADLVDDCAIDLSLVSDTAEGLAAIIDAIVSAAGDLRWWANAAKEEYSYIENGARAWGLVVEGGYVTISSPDDEELAKAFNEYKERADIQAGNLARAHNVFSSELDKLKIGTYEQLIEPVFDALKQQVMPDPNHPWLNDMAYVKNMTSLGGKAARAYFVYKTTGRRVKVSSLFTKGWWEEFCAKLPGKWKRSSTPRAIKVVEGLGRAAGTIGIALSGIATAYDTYNEDTVKHPEWGTGHKVARATVKAVSATAGGYLGSAAGSYLGGQAGAAIGALFPAAAPFTAAAGEFLGGIGGGLIGGELGERFGDFANEQGVERIVRALG